MDEKDLRRIGRARNARINRAVTLAQQITSDLEGLQGRQYSEHVDSKGRWLAARQRLAELCQCFHEANAYNNAVGETDGEV